MPHLKTLHVTWDSYAIPFGVSNAVLVLEKQTSLGMTRTPFKATAYFPLSRTNGYVNVLAPGTYWFRAVAQAQPLPQSEPSNTNNIVVAP
jgi:hypothetical protein